MKLIERTNKLDVKKQCRLLDVNRSRVYYKRRPVSDIDATITNEIKIIYTSASCFGYRKIYDALRRRGYLINKKKVYRLMSKAGLQAVYPKKRTTIRNTEHAVYPYLLRDLEVTHANQAWGTDITYIRVGKGFVYLVCLIDLYSRRVMGWAVSPFMSTDLCLEALYMALLNAVPEIINSDQGSQFTSHEWIEALKKSGIKVSMDGKGRWVDNVHVERLWRTIKYEGVYLHSFQTVHQAKEVLGRFIDWYNKVRSHQSLGYKTPAEIYIESIHTTAVRHSNAKENNNVQLYEREVHSEIGS